MSDSEIARLCRQIYRQHRHAIDLIYEHRPDRRSEMRHFLEDLIREETHLVLDESNKYYIRFIPKDWDQDTLKADETWAEKWTKTGRMLLFEFLNRDTIGVKLTIGPGPEAVRQKLLDMALREDTFNPRRKVLARKWNNIFSRTFLKLEPEPYEDDNDDEVREKLRQEWTKFLEHDLPTIDALKQENWIWEAAESQQ